MRRRSRPTASISHVSRELELRAGGSLTVGADATFVASYDLQDPQAGAIEGAGRRNFANFGTSTPEWKPTPSRNGRPIGMPSTPSSATSTHTSTTRSTSVRAAAFFRPIDSQITLDAQYTLTLQAARAPKLTFGAINLDRRGSAARADERRLRLEGARSARAHAVREGAVQVLKEPPSPCPL